MLKGGMFFFFLVREDVFIFIFHCQKQLHVQVVNLGWLQFMPRMSRGKGDCSFTVQ